MSPVSVMAAQALRVHTPIMPASRSSIKAMRMGRLLGEMPLEELPPVRKKSTRKRQRGKIAGPAGRASKQRVTLGDRREEVPAGAIGSVYLRGGYTAYRLQQPRTFRCAKCLKDT